MNTLSPDQVTAAILKLTSHWATQPFPDSVKDTWRRKLSTLNQGEFTPAFDTWLEGPRSRFRPDVGEFMELVVRDRGDERHRADYDRTQRFLADQRAVVPSSPEHAASVLTAARATLGTERKSHPDRPEVKARMFDEAKSAFRRYVEIATEGDEESPEAIAAWRELAGALS